MEDFSDPQSATQELTDISPTLQTYTKSHQNETAYFIAAYIVPLIMIFGIFSNIISIIVLWRNASKKSLPNYLVCLAFVDIGYMIMMCLSLMCYVVFNISLLALTKCTMVQFHVLALWV